jgi:hypothetical protein
VPGGGTTTLDPNRGITNLPVDEKEDKAARLDRFDRAAQQAERSIEILKAEQDAVGATAGEHARLRVEAQLTSALLEAGIEINDEYAARIDAIAQATERAATRLDDAKQRFQGFNESVRFAGNELVGVFDRMMQKGAEFKDIMGDVLRSVSKQLLQAAITGEGAFAKILGLSSPVQGGVGGILGALFGGARAGGGSVTAGRAYQVGENGTEWFVPGRSGTVVPAGGGGGFQFSYAPSYQVEGSGPEIDQLRLEMQRDRVEAPQRAIAAFRDAKSRRLI